VYATAFVLGLGLFVVAITPVMFAHVKSASRRQQAAFDAIALYDIAELFEGARVRVVGVASSLTDDKDLVWTSEVSLGAEEGDPGPVIIAKRFAITDATGRIEVAIDHVELHIPDVAYERRTSEQRLPFDLASSGTYISRHRLVAGMQVAIVASVRRAADGTLELAGSRRRPVVIRPV
jgi:hypothetical protein